MTDQEIQFEKTKLIPLFWSISPCKCQLSLHKIEVQGISRFLCYHQQVFWHHKMAVLATEYFNK